MQNWEQRQKVVEFVKAAFECSVYLAPRDPGLTLDEVIEIGGRAGFQPGEIRDAIPASGASGHFRDPKLKPALVMMHSQFHSLEEPDYRNAAAFDFVCAELGALVRSDGVQSARLDRAVVVARAVSAGLPEVDVEAAITIMVTDQHLVEEAGVIRFGRGRETYPLASEQLARISDLHQRRPQAKPARARAYPIVRDIVERRTDGRPQKAEPLQAFAAALDRLGYAPFLLWWKQTVAELARGDANLSPVTVSVLSAALVEGALTFVVKHARTLELGVFGSKDFEREPRTWKIDDLVASAATGKESAILDTATRLRADGLIRSRQRIHAGRMLSEFPTGVPDLRPEEAREARATADLVVRRILDWLEKYPPATA